MLNIEELDKKFDELLKDFDKEYIDGWIRKKIEEEKLEQQSKRSEQLFCGTCNKFEVCKDLCKETDPFCKIYKAK